MVNFRGQFILFALMMGFPSVFTAETYGQFGGGGTNVSHDESVTLTKTLLTDRGWATIGTGNHHVKRLSDPNLYRNRGYLAATMNAPTTQLIFYLWIRHNGLEDSKDRIQAEEFHGSNLGSVIRLKIKSQDLSETITLVRRKQQENQARLVVRGISLNGTEPVYLHLDLTAQKPKLRRISPTWDNLQPTLIRHEELAELFAVIDELEDRGMLVLEDITAEMEGDTQFAEQAKREFEGFFE